MALTETKAIDCWLQ